ncbi:protein CFAP276-like [Periplaneta americana]|uniref:protein CFAP276-like n=1 Tax=Periplaneta americana TaxID=6978 RepID=UPI0037E82EE6
MEKHIRNDGPIPFLEREGLFIKEIPIKAWIQAPIIKRAAELKGNKSVTKKNVDKTTDNGFSALEIQNGKTIEKKLRKSGHKEKASTEKGTQEDIRLNPNWAKDLPSFQRLFAHHTLSSIRRSTRFMTLNAPRDKLDFVLDSVYRHEAELFPEKTDVYLQPESLGRETWRVLRNNKHILPPGVVTRDHPIRFGGIKQRPNIFNVKLGIPAPHVAQTNAGYSRREDGALYKV